MAAFVGQVRALHRLAAVLTRPQNGVVPACFLPAADATDLSGWAGFSVARLLTTLTGDAGALPATGGEP